MYLLLQRIERIQTFVDAQKDIAALTAVSASRAASGNEFLTSKCDYAVTAVATAHIDTRLIKEHRSILAAVTSSHKHALR